MINNKKFVAMGVAALCLLGSCAPSEMNSSKAKEFIVNNYSGKTVIQIKSCDLNFSISTTSTDEEVKQYVKDCAQDAAKQVGYTDYKTGTLSFVMKNIKQTEDRYWDIISNRCNSIIESKYIDELEQGKQEYNYQSVYTKSGKEMSIYFTGKADIPFEELENSSTIKASTSCTDIYNENGQVRLSSRKFNFAKSEGQSENITAKFIYTIYF